MFAGHSPGSVVVHDAGGGVLVTGDTLYHTDHGLIDWYPGSNISQMEESVATLRDIIRSGTVETGEMTNHE